MTSTTFYDRVSPEESSGDGSPRHGLPPPPSPPGPRPPPSLHFRGPAAEDIPIWRDCLLACGTLPGTVSTHWSLGDFNEILDA